MISRYFLSYALLLISVSCSTSVFADWSDFLNMFSSKEHTVAVTESLPTDEDLIAGLKQVLLEGSKVAVQRLGKENGFFKNPDLRIAMPVTLKKIEQGLRAMNQDKIVDEFILIMNRTAERSVPKTLDIVMDLINKIKINDAKLILHSNGTAATDYFRTHSAHELNQTLLPIIQQETQKSDITQSYKNVLAQFGFIGKFIDIDAFNLEQYVTSKTIDALFVVIGEQERLIREDPVARTTALLKKVFLSQ